MDGTAIPKYRYSAELANELEKKWQNYWEENNSFTALNPSEVSEPEQLPSEKYFLLDMFPYPSGKGLHVGHPLGYIATDVVARYQRMLGKNVLYTMGYDAFGLPAEQFAITTGQHPAITTAQNIANMERQLHILGLSHEKRRSFATTDPEYVRWTQWIFLQIFNSWYDREAPGRLPGTVGRARPIAELIAEFAAGKRETSSGKAWQDLSAVEQSGELDNYRLAYISSASVNWAPGLGTVLANEEVTADGRSERGNFPVFKKQLRQWMMRITAYADRLVADLDKVDWPEKVVTMQRNWIGASTGAQIYFPVLRQAAVADNVFDVQQAFADSAERLQVFTTRPDTLFGATFAVIAPEHPLVGEVEAKEAELRVPPTWPENTKEEWTGGYASPAAAVAAYRRQAFARTAADRIDADRKKTGIFTGLFAVNPVNGRAVPVFMADYVLWGYASGAIMAVPAHDGRDWDFAKEYDIDIIPTIKAPADFAGGVWEGDGEIINSANDAFSINGMDVDRAKVAVTKYLESIGAGREKITYRLRDWLFSRQRYWGEPFPVVYSADGRVHALPESQLPLLLPEISDFNPRTFAPDDADSQPEPPLGRVGDWLEVELDLGEGRQKYRRDTNTMPNWAGSCAYEIRYINPANDRELVDPIDEKYWMGPADPQDSGGTDLYVGGVEHAVLHLLYSRFWHKVLFDLGFVSSCEPFHKLFNQGYIQAYAYTDARGQYVTAAEVEGDEQSGFTWKGQPVTREYGKMGKSLKNIITPDEFCAQYGADTFRTFLMSMGPLDISRPWDNRATVGAQRFLQRLWRNVVDEDTGQLCVVDVEPDLETQKLTARTIDQVRLELDNLRINTAIAKMIVLNNHLTSLAQVPRSSVETLILLVAPIAPHIAEELWQRLGHRDSLVKHPYPQVSDPALLAADEVTCVVQIQGKIVERLQVDPEISAGDLEAAAVGNSRVAAAIAGRDIVKIIVRAPKLVNIVLQK